LNFRLDFLALLGYLLAIAVLLSKKGFSSGTPSEPVR
jgi:hypothetical protein